MKIGSKIYFKTEKKPYTIRAKNSRYLVCTKPFDLQHTVFYTIIDLLEQKRSSHNIIFNPFDFTTQKGCNECLKWLINGRAELSRRNQIELDILKIK